VLKNSGKEWVEEMVGAREQVRTRSKEKERESATT